MSILSSLFDFFGSIFNDLWDFMKENWLLILIVVLAVVLMNPALLTTIGAWLETAGVVLTWIGANFVELLLGGMFVWLLVDPEGAISFVTDTIGEVVSTVSSALGLDKLALWAVLGVGTYYFFIKDKDKKNDSEQAGVAY